MPSAAISSPIRLVVVEDEPLYRDLLVSSMVSRLGEVDVVASYADAESMLDDVDVSSVDALLADIDLGPGMDGTQAGIALRRRRPGLGVILLSNLAMPGLLATLPEDVQGGWAYLLKTSVTDIDQLGLAIHEAIAGRVAVDKAVTRNLVPTADSPLRHLTQRQMQVLSGIANGWSNKRISEELLVSVRTVESNVSDIIAALDVPRDIDGYNTRVALAVTYLRHSVTDSTQRHTPR